MLQLHATPTTTTTNQLRISTGTVGRHNAAIIATGIRACKGKHVPLHKLHWLLHHTLQQLLCRSWSGRWQWWFSCMLLLHPIPTCTTGGTDLCTLHLCFLLSTGTSTPVVHVMVSPTATCTGFLSNHWHKSCTTTQVAEDGTTCASGVFVSVAHYNTTSTICNRWQPPCWNGVLAPVDGARVRTSISIS